MGYSRGSSVQSVLISSILSLIRVFSMFAFSLVIQTLITNNNKESDKLRNLNVQCYYNASGMGDTICSIGEEINKPLVTNTNQ